jgi:hypothetical protein
MPYFKDSMFDVNPEPIFRVRAGGEDDRMSL